MRQLQITLAAQPEISANYRKSVIDMLSPSDVPVVTAQDELKLDELRRRGFIRQVPKQQNGTVKVGS